MTFDQAKNTVIKFGKYNGKSIIEISETNEGLLYLDWLVEQTWVRSPLDDALKTYLNDPVVAKDVEIAVDEYDINNMNSD